MVKNVADGGCFRDRYVIMVVGMGVSATFTYYIGVRLLRLLVQPYRVLPEPQAGERAISTDSHAILFMDFKPTRGIQRQPKLI